MVSIKAEFDIFAYSKTQGVNSLGTTKAQRTRTVNDIQTKIADRTNNIFLKRKMTEQYGERVDDQAPEAGYRIKRFRKDAVKMIGNNGTT